MKINKLKMFLPTEYIESIFEIDYERYFLNGFNTLFFDLDNTIADYDTYEPDNKTKELFNRLKRIGFEIVILSNNKGGRVLKFSESLNVRAYYSLMKPLKIRLKKHIKLDNILSEKILWIGDQLVTDIFLASKLNIKSILVDPINRSSEKWYTKYLNRKIEKRKYKQIKKYLYSEYIELGLKYDGR